MDDRTLTPAEAAQLIGCSEYTVKKLAREKKIPSFRVNKLIRFREQSLIRWIVKQEKINYTDWRS